MGRRQDRTVPSTTPIRIFDKDFFCFRFLFVVVVIGIPLVFFLFFVMGVLEPPHGVGFFFVRLLCGGDVPHPKRRA